MSTASPENERRVWVLLTEVLVGGWGLWGHAPTNAVLVDAARAQIAELSPKTASD